MCGKLIVNSVKIFCFYNFKQYCYFILFVFVQSRLCTLVQTCPEETSKVSTNISQKVTWKAKDINNEIVLSDPPCTDDTENLITRICFNGSWIPKHPPVCRRTVGNNKNCPMLFKEVEDNCIYISEPQTWDTRCSLMKNKTDSKYLVRRKDDLVWLPFKRKFRYGPYELVTAGENYGENLEKFFNLSYRDDIFNKNCIISGNHKQSIEPEYCDNSHIHICAFYNDYEVHVCPTNCISAGIGTSKCYCKRRSNICQNFAEINTPFDRNILTDFVKEDECYVGEKISTNLSLQGYRQALHKKRWFYTKRHLNCSICSIQSADNILNVEMVLNFEAKFKKLYLLIYSPEGLFKNGQEDYIYCFTDASKQLKKRVEVEKVFEYFNKTNSNERTFYVYKVELEKYMGYYWCEAHKKSLSDELVYSNKIIAYKKKEGNEYSLRLVINSVCQYFNCQFAAAIPYDDFTNNIASTIFRNFKGKIRIMEVFYFDYYKMDVLVHLSSDKRRDIVPEFYKITEELKNISRNVKVEYFRSSEFCLPELTTSGQTKLSWPLTDIDSSVVSEEICLQSNGLPTFRVCKGSFLYGAEWSHINGNCQNDPKISENAKYLHSLINRNLSQPFITNISHIIEREGNLSVLEIYYLEKIFQNIYHANVCDVHVINSTFDITNSLLKIKSKNLIKAQSILNSTDIILDTLEDILTKSELGSEVYLIQKKSVVVHITNPFLSNVSGVIVSSSANNDLIIENFARNNTFDNIINKPYVELAVYVPEKILQDIFEQNLTNIHIMTTIFFNDHLFVSSSRKPLGPIVSVSISDYGSYLPTPLPVLFKAFKSQETPECGFWDYGKKTQRGKGHWSMTGGNYLGHINNESSTHICSFSHLTHFGLLILDESISVEFLDETDDYFLSVITLVGGALTAIGITAIFLTAALFDKWRKRQGTKILLNLSIAILLEALTMHLIEIKGFINSDFSCRVIGSITHYIVLSKFFWMLVYAFLQYMRFVKVFGILPDNIVIKSAIIGWGFAVIPVLIVNLVSPFSYSIKDYHFCYPKDMSLYLGVIMPVVLIIFINLFVFCLVMYQVSTKRIESRCGNADSYKLQLKLATLLFFVLGIPWMFGVLANLITIHWLKTIFVYVFCATSTVQGFILFLFYVVFNKETRLYWTNYFFKIKVSLETSSKTS